MDVEGGQKTGFYLDQRDNRRILGALAAGGSMLDAFSYTGGFACSAPLASRAVCVDTSQSAAELGARNAELNGMRAKIEFVRADVFEYLRGQPGERFDLIVLDPPKMAHGPREVEGALRGYKDLVMHALPLLAAGGLLAVFSCAAAVGWHELHRASAWAAIDAGRPIRSVGWLSQAADHPVPASFPESHYLTGILWQAD